MVDNTGNTPARERLPIKLIMPKQGTERRIAGGGGPALPFRAVTPEYRQCLATQVAAITAAIAPQLKEKLASGGIAIFSGISKENLPKIEKCFTAAAGWEEIDHQTGEGWCGMTLRKKL